MITNEWDNEPNTFDWTHKGIECHIQRCKHNGALCGYVRVPSNHKLDHVEYEHVLMRVHGGLTYSGAAYWLTTSDWWIGFDCAHFGDFCPKYDLTLFDRAVYRNMAYVKAECEGLADQVLNYKTEQTT